jgi:hypothetical protein
MKQFFFFSVCIACVFSCASVKRNDSIYVNLTDKSKFALLPPEGIEYDMDMVQFLSAEFRGENYFFYAWVIANEEAIEMTFLNEMGATMGELSYRNNTVNFSSAVIPAYAMRFFKPEYIIADFQLCFYDPFLLAKSLKDCGFVLEDTIINRRILNGNEVIVEIKKSETMVEFVNHLQGYSYTLEGRFHGIR